MGAAVLEPLVEEYPVQTRAVFFGLVVVGISVPARMVSRWDARALLLAAAAAAAPDLPDGIRTRLEPTVDGTVEAALAADRSLAEQEGFLVKQVAQAALAEQRNLEAQIEQPLDFLRYVVLQADELFLLWSVLGGLVAPAITRALHRR